MVALRKRQVGITNYNPPLPLSAVEMYRLYIAEHNSELGHLAQFHRAAAEGLLRGDLSPLKEVLGLVSEFRDDRQLRCHFQAMGFLSKNKLKGAMPRIKAHQKFDESERRCRRTNKRLAWFARYPNREHELYRVILCRARETIRETLGELTPRTFEAILDLARPGSGVSIGTCDPLLTGWEYKYGPETAWCCTLDALPYAKLLVEGSQAWCECVGVPCLKPVPGNRVSWVDKNTFTDRTIAVEPALNVQLQLGVGRWIAARLTGKGIDLRDQCRNQRAAVSAGQRWQDVNPWATIDLSSASDTISIELVRRLLPTDWFGLLDDLRSKSGRYLGQQLVYEKFSSMGNGFTFPLETLIFWAIARAVNTMVQDVSSPIVYGDDIIVRRSAAGLLLETLKYCGFVPNVDKTFLFGPFRESCGVNVYGGTDVTPIRISTLQLRPSDVYHLLNKVRMSSDFASRLHAGMRGIPILRGPFDQDNPNGHLWSTSWDRVKVRGGPTGPALQVRAYKTLVFRPQKRRAPEFGAYVASLAGATGGDRRLRDEQDARRCKEDRRSSVPRRGHWVHATRYARS